MFLNEVRLIGRTTRDFDVRQAGEAKQNVYRAVLAVNEEYMPRGGGSPHRCTSYIDLQAWGRVGEHLFKHVGKGSLLLILGRLRVNHWEDERGRHRQTVVEVTSHQVIERVSAEKRHVEPSNSSGGEAV